MGVASAAATLSAEASEAYLLWHVFCSIFVTRCCPAPKSAGTMPLYRHTRGQMVMTTQPITCKRLALILLVMGFLLTVTACWASTQYAITVLDGREAVDISNSNQILINGYASGWTSGIWENGVVRDLGGLPSPEGRNTIGHGRATMATLLAPLAYARWNIPRLSVERRRHDRIASIAQLHCLRTRCCEQPGGGRRILRRLTRIPLTSAPATGETARAQYGVSLERSTPRHMQ